MPDQPNQKQPEILFLAAEAVTLTGTMAIYSSQDEASAGIPQQWRAFLAAHPEVAHSANLYGASPCTGDGRIHYLSGTAPDSMDGPLAGESLVLKAGEYAVVHVTDATALRATWTWLLGTWLPSSGRRERHAPEFERYTGLSTDGLPVGPVEIWIPLEPLRKN